MDFGTGSLILNIYSNKFYPGNDFGSEQTVIIQNLPFGSIIKSIIPLLNIGATFNVVMSPPRISKTMFGTGISEG
jgi:hypothetical protein